MHKDLTKVTRLAMRIALAALIFSAVMGVLTLEKDLIDPELKVKLALISAVVFLILGAIIVYQAFRIRVSKPRSKVK